MHFRSLRFKLTVWYVLILGILLISFSSFLYFTLSKSLHRDVDNKLRSLAELIASESSSPLSKFGFGNIDQALETSMNLKPIGKFIQVLDESGYFGRKSDNFKRTTPDQFTCPEECLQRCGHFCNQSFFWKHSFKNHHLPRR